MLTPLDKEIIKALADNDMSVLAVSKGLFMHYSTINYHLAKIHRETGLNPRKFYDLLALLDMIKNGKGC